jgi:hypothetical protein
MDQGQTRRRQLPPIESGWRQSEAERGIGSDQTRNVEGGVFGTDTLNVEAGVRGECRVINVRDAASSGIVEWIEGVG